MRKKALLALMMAAVLMLSGCALIQKDQAVDDATEIIRLGDQTVTKKEVKDQTDYQLYTWSLLYPNQVDITSKEVIAAAQEMAVNNLKQNLVLTAKAKELGLDQLTDEEKETVQTAAQEAYDKNLESAKQFVEGAADMDADALTKAAAEQMEASGYTLDAYVTSQTAKLVETKLTNYINKDVTVTDDEIQAEYDSKVASDKTTYGESAASWAAAANYGYTLYYTPAGVRRVKQILTKFTDEDQTAIKDAKAQLDSANSARTLAQDKIDSAQSHLDAEGITDEDKAKYEAELNAAKQELDDADKALLAANQAVTDATDKAFAAIDEKADSILAELDKGGDWQELMDKYNDDPGMKSNEKGYAMAEGISGYDAAFVEAALGLKKPGDYSSKIKGDYGYYIIRYESDEAEGAIALDAVKESLSDSLLHTKQDNQYDETVANWIQESGIKVDLNALND